MSIVRANGIDMHVEEVAPAGPTSSAPPVAVLIHGMASDSMASWYLSLAHPLAEAGMRVLLYDLRGHGRSDRPAQGYALDDFLADLDALLAHWGVTGPVHLFGNSFGGTVAFGYATRHPEKVASIVTVESSPPTPTWFARMARRLGQVTTVRADGRGPMFARRLAQTSTMLAETSLSTELPASRLPAAVDFAAVTCPVLCLYGGRSVVQEMADETRALMPQAETVVFPDQKHTLLIDQPHQVRDRVLPWLRLSHVH